MNKQVEVESLNNEILNSINLDGVILFNKPDYKMYMNCNYSCSGHCGSCAGSCDNGCNDTCYTGCDVGCRGSDSWNLDKIG